MNEFFQKNDEYYENVKCSNSYWRVLLVSSRDVSRRPSSTDFCV